MARATWKEGPRAGKAWEVGRWWPPTLRQSPSLRCEPCEKEERRERIEATPWPPAEPPPWRCSGCEKELRWAWHDGPRPEYADRPHQAGKWWPPGYECDPCKNHREAAEREAALRKELSATGLPPRYQCFRFDRFEQLPRGGDWRAFRDRLPEGVLGVTSWNLALARRLRAEAARPTSVYVVGPVGSGKTTIIAAAVVAMVSAGVEVLYITESDLWERSREERRRQAKGAGSILYAAARVRVLVIDDFGSCEDGRDWQYDAMETLVGRRYDHRLHTLFTSNVPLTSVEGIYGPRVSTRLYEMCRGDQVLLAGVNWRTGEEGDAPLHAEPAPPHEPARANPTTACGECGYSPCRCGRNDTE